MAISVVVLLCALGVSVSAATIYVPGNYSQIDDAIAAPTTVNGDTIIVSPGTYEPIDFRGKNIVVTSTDPNDPNIVAATVIDADADTNNPASVVSFNGTEGTYTTYECALMGFTITGGYAYYINPYDPDGVKTGDGGGINGGSIPYVQSGTMADIINCVIENNYAAVSGGGIFGTRGNIIGCIVRNNIAGHYFDAGFLTPEGYGGGMADHSGSGVIQDCVIENNTALRNGGGLHGCSEVKDCDILNNTVSNDIAFFETHGGGAYRSSLTKCLIQGNQALGDNLFDEEDESYTIICATGGGLDGCVATECNIIDNISEGNGGGVCGGGGVYVDSCSNCLIENNSAALNGGGVFGGSCSNSKVYNNSANGGGGGGALSGSLANCHVKGNTAYWGGGVSDEVKTTNILAGSGVTAIGCLIEDNSAVVGGGVYVYLWGKVINCTIVQNEGDGIYVDKWPNPYYPPIEPPFLSGPLTCINSIIWGNSRGEIRGDLTHENTLIEYNCISKFSGHRPGTIDAANNIIGIYPGFVDPCAGDYHIMPYLSVFTPPYYPPIDYGTTDVSYLIRDYMGNIDYENNKDMDGNNRVRDVFGPNSIDMGAYEYDPNDPDIPIEPNIPIELDYRHYTLDEEDGLTAYDYGLVNHYNGVFVNNPVWKPNDGVFGGALHFDGTNDYVIITDPNYYGITGSNPRTCSAWVKTTYTGNYQMIMSWGSTDVDGYNAWMIALKSTGQLAVSIFGAEVHSTTTGLNDGRWHHVVVTLSEDLNNDNRIGLEDIQLYVDGQPETRIFLYNSASVVVDTSGETPVTLGVGDYGGYPYGWTHMFYFHGLMDDVQICQAAWDAEDVNEYYQSARVSQLRDEAVIYYNCDEGTGTTLIDLGGDDQQDGIYNGSWTTLGVFGGALSFDGSDDYVELSGYDGVVGNNPRTCSAWIKTTYTGSYQMIMSWGSTDVDGYNAWMIALKPTGDLAVSIFGAEVDSTTTNLNDGGWHHVVVTLSEDLNNDNRIGLEEIQLYVDGQPETRIFLYNSASVVVDTSGETPVTLGVGDYGGYPYGWTYMFYFHGLMDDVRIYDQALTGGDIQVLYKER
jgi:parallel beta-helix repeat protein